jgi:hypothetical protein
MVAFGQGTFEACPRALLVETIEGANKLTHDKRLSVSSRVPSGATLHRERTLTLGLFRPAYIQESQANLQGDQRWRSIVQAPCNPQHVAQ